MSKVVVISLGKRDLGAGFSSVTAQIWSDDNSKPEKFTGKLSADRDMAFLFRQWQQLYEACYKRLRLRGSSAIEIEEEEATGFSEAEFNDLSGQLQKQINAWLESNEFRRIDQQLRSHLDPAKEVQVIVETDDDLAQRLPWQLWDFFRDFRQAEFALSPLDYIRPDKSPPTIPRTHIRILAILGDGSGIDIQADRKLLENLPDAETIFLVEPDRQELDRWLWDDQGWDILFFAGHSQTEGDKGRIYINPTESLTISQLTNALSKAIELGLHLAIFNSCDGIGLARELADLYIPQMVIMREPVPDRVAEEFLKHFLTAFSSGKSLYTSVREARERLQGLEGDFPCASWLPVICQNPAETPKTWQELLETQQAQQSMPTRPYQGLFAFQEEDAQLFFGRETFTEQLVAAVQDKPLVGVIGASGSGKSSVVFAGLIPRLREAGNWQIIDIRTGDRPFHNLATALVPLLDPNIGRTERLLRIKQLAAEMRKEQGLLRELIAEILSETPDTRLLLTIDQFEELYTLCRDAEERQCFLDRLLDTVKEAPRFTLVLTLRADFYGQVLSSRPFADALQNADIKLGPMTRQELEDAIVKPAELFDVQMEPGLTRRILDEVEEEPGSLPLLEFALTQLWEKRSEGLLTHAAYSEIGGIKVALARYADEVFEQLTPEEQQQAQSIFIQLVRPGEGTEDTRRVATRADIGESNWGLVKRLADARLVVTGRQEKTVVDQNQATAEVVTKIEAEETVEVVHEALIREWECLRNWMNANRDFRVWQDRLKEERRQWENTGRDEGALLRGVPLATAEDWLHKRQSDLSPDEREYIQKSIDLREQLKTEQERSQAERLRLQRRAISWLAGGLAVSVVLGGVAVLQGLRAEFQKKQAQNSEVKALNASSQELLSSDQKFDALLESLRGVTRLTQGAKANDQTQTQLATLLQEAVNSTRERNRLEGHEGPIYNVSFSPDGEMLASASGDGTVKLWHHDGTLVTTLKGHEGTVRDVNFSPDGQKIVTTGDDGTVRLWDLSGKQLNQWSGEEYTGIGIRLGDKPDTEGKNTFTLIILEVSKNKPAQKAGLQKDDLILSINGQKTTGLESVERAAEIIKSELQGKPGREVTLRIYRPDTGEQDIKIKTETIKSRLYKAIFSPDGKTLATTDGNSVKLWDLDGNLLKTLEKNVLPIKDISFSPDGKLIASASGDGFKLWKPDGTLVKSIKNADLTSISFSPDGSGIVIGDAQGYVKLWSRDGEWLRTITKENFTVRDVAFSPDSSKIVATFNNGLTGLWSTDGNLIDVLQGHQNIASSVSFSPDGKTIATASFDRTVRLWNAENISVTSLEGHSSGAYGVNFSPDGKTIVSVGGDSQIQLWSSNETLLKESWDGKETEWGVTFSPDGQLIATFGRGKVIKLWKNDGTLYATLKGHREFVNRVSFSPNGEMIVSGSDDKTVRLWKRDGSLIKILEDNSQDEKSDFTKSVSFSPDGKIIATASGEIVKLWNQDGILLKTLQDHRNTVFSVSFSPDGKKIATASFDKTVNIYNFEGTLIATLQGHQAEVYDVKFNPDGKRIATASADDTVRIWNLDGKLLTTLKGHNNDVYNLSFSPDGKTLASAGGDGKIILWDLDLDLEKIRVKACHLVRDYLKNNPKVEKGDRSLCDGVERDWRAEGEELAQAGDIDGAIEMFQKAKQSDSTLKINPEKKAKELAALALVEKGERLVIQGKVNEAIDAYKEAQNTYQELQISADSWNVLCWRGSKYGYAAQVMYACENTLEKANSELKNYYRDSRGFARLLIGDKAGAVEDFQAFVAWWDDIKSQWTDEQDKKRKQRMSQRRQRWVKEIKAGKNFSPEEIKKEMELLWREE
ncbi:eIF2A-related protein [Gloeothece verrucosa]|uniref:WD40 repeat, subgroup n=1 Tax=Gloeothece verrucosa (strain PCC 7822) TaxID=497965 RepID=E0UNY6_GLOV7|nr:CHAT domain-containing protein [Gloeothece verrucosa]ADN18666.1 WD40 repeat, subgroup [Gloeothece verrucosa PCC 7822]